METVELLYEEIRLIEDAFEENSCNPAQIRVLIRSTFAIIEALVASMMKRAIQGIVKKSSTMDGVNTHDERHKLFFEICALYRLSYQINDNGILNLKPTNINFKNKILFAIRSLAKSNDVNIDPKQIEGWNSFVSATKIRNRVTHPDKETDLMVNKKDYDTVISAMRWVVICNHRANGLTQY